MFYNRKKFLSIILTLVFLVGVSLCAFAASYIGNKNTKKFHESDCHWVQKIKQENILYLKDRDQAINNGYIPCKVCQP